MTYDRKKLYKDLEKKFSIFRWFLILFVAPISLNLSDFNENYKTSIIFFVCAAIYNLLVTIAAYSKTGKFRFMLGMTLYIDIPLISVLILMRGGLRSDIYLIYYLVILYDGSKFGFKGTIIGLLQSVFFYSIASFAPYFFQSQEVDTNRFFIRMIYLITLTIVMYDVNRELTNSRSKEKIARDMAQTDPLTQLPNRMLLSDFYDKLRKKSEDKNQSFAIALFDIDNFKQINDTKGHTFGDQVLLALANVFKNHLNEDDFICRFGGEEFLAFFSNCDKDKALKKANKIREEIASIELEGILVTVSIGINMYQKECTMIENINYADEAMYAVKNTGKNQVLIHEDICKLV